MTEPLALDEYAIASTIVSKIWAAALPALRSAGSQQTPIYFPGALDRQLVERARLPIGADRAGSQIVALVDAERFDRHGDDHSVGAAYSSRPRTKVYEGIDARSDGWYSVAALQLARLARCRVVCTMYESRSGDLNLGAHVDEWLGVIVQMRGAKAWHMPAQFGQLAHGVTTQPGDILVVPAHYMHDVETENRSVHLVFAFMTEMRF
ncbi:JmjC domain-containing protein [Nocardia farcinica]|uniref:JmjC domain-containing protein n=1 Tax=Nocardia farcinica TaxID=37329 RepID=UPI002455824A|nr:cupin domain-containing protein [Nocardia farcinica]